MKKSACTFVTALALGVLSAPSVDAAPLVDLTSDFDTTFPDNPFPSGNARVNVSGGVDAGGNGVGGTNDAFLDMDLTPILTDPGFAFASITLIDSNLDNAAFTSTDPADYTLSFDAKIEGLLPDQTAASVNVSVFFNNGGPGYGWNGVQVTEDYTSFSFNAAAANGSPPPFDVSGSTIGNVKFELLFPDTTLGADTGNVLRIDNVALTLIPEPASAALLAAGSLMMLRRRRSA